MWKIQYCAAQRKHASGRMKNLLPVLHRHSFFIDFPVPDDALANLKRPTLGLYPVELLFRDSQGPSCFARMKGI